jgi:hypothetical protein
MNQFLVFWPGSQEHAALLAPQKQKDRLRLGNKLVRLGLHLSNIRAPLVIIDVFVVPIPILLLDAWMILVPPIVLVLPPVAFIVTSSLLVRNQSLKSILDIIFDYGVD